MELEKYFQDVDDDALGYHGDTDEPDLERDQRMKTAYQKIRCVYPHITSQKNLHATDAPSLLAHPNVKNILGKRKTIMSDNLDSFAEQIRPYIDSTASKENDSSKAFVQWPLVKLVQLYIKSDILKNGLVLVDLPGNMDTNAARGAIAADYQKNLTVTCVVAPTARAASDKPVSTGLRV